MCPYGYTNLSATGAIGTTIIKYVYRKYLSTLWVKYQLTAVKIGGTTWVSINILNDRLLTYKFELGIQLLTDISYCKQIWRSEIHLTKYI